MPGHIWTDWLHQQATPCERLVAESRPHLVKQLDALLLSRRRAGKPPPRLRVESSGHSTSDVARPSELLVVLDREKWHDDPQHAKWLPTSLPSGHKPVWVAANATVKRANALLSARKLCFENLGSYDKQSVFGAITTGTHGTGRDLAPLADIVLALDVVVIRPDAAGALRCESLRIEREDAPISTARYVADAKKDPSLPQLVRDTALFDAAIVSMGAFGIVTGLVVRARPEFWLKEDRTATWWGDAKQLIDPASPAEEPWLDLAITSRKLVTKDDWGVLVTRRSECPKGGIFVRNDRRTQVARAQYDAHGPDRNDVASFLASLGCVAPDIATGIAWNSFRKEVDEEPFQSRSDRVLFTSIGDYVGVSSMEVCVPRSDWKAAVTTTLETLRQLGHDGYHSLTPVGVRFSTASRATLAPQVGRATCTIEVGCLVGVFSVLHSGKSSWEVIDHILSTVEAELMQKHQGRPHWGQKFFSDAATIEKAYPAGTWATWKAQRAKVDPARLFDSSFTARMGL